MTPDASDPAERLRALESIFHAALQRPPAERPAFVRDACGDDTAMRAEVERMLAREGATDFLADAHLDARRAPAPSTGEMRGRRNAGDLVGPYRLIEPIGHGGMGVVWRASREGEFEREVAVKLIRRGADSDDVIERFRTERQVLAGLQHSNIASLLDGGATDDGQPYIVLEYVDGIPITQYCEERSPSIDDRLRLFLKTCDAVQHAHRSLIIHRDLKPGNILVTEDGEPKLLDFGIAKVLDSAATDAAVTATQQRRFTPHYASPEQVRGETLTTATDVYSLGVLLYEMLTGARPYELTDVPPTDYARIICESEPRRPSEMVTSTADGHGSTSTEARRRRKRLTGDLDRIVMMAMRKEPARRYDSVEQLAGDVRLHLEGLPVRAQPDTLGYRTGKFARRHRTGLAAGGLLTMSLFAGLIGTTSQARRADAARVDAVAAQEEEKTARQDAEAVNLFLFNLFRTADPRGGDAEMTIREAMDVAADRVDEDLAARPLARAYVRLSLGTTYRTLSKLERAGPHLEQAIALYEQELGADDPETLSARHELAILRMDQGRFATAEEIARAVLTGRRRVLGPENAKTVLTLELVAQTRVRQDDAEEATKLIEEAIAIRERIGPDDPDLFVTRKELANLLSNAGRTEEALPVFERVLADQERILGPDHLDTIITMSDLASAYSHSGQQDEAVVIYRRAVERMAKILAPDHFDRLIVEMNLGTAIHRQQRYAEAIALLRDVLARAEGGLGAEHFLTSYIRLRLGISLLRDGKLEEAEPLLRRSHEIFLRDFGADHGYTQDASGWLEELEKARAEEP